MHLAQRRRRRWPSSKICEAYARAVQPARRAIYDQYGERGLKDGVPDGKGGVKGGKYRFNNNPTEIFTAFFARPRLRTSSAMAAARRCPSSTR